MSFVLFYGTSDLAGFVNGLGNANIKMSAADKRLGDAIWNGGLSTWQTAPLAENAPAPYNETRMPGGANYDPDQRYVVIAATVQGQTVTAQQMIDLLRRVAADSRNANVPNIGFLNNLASDMSCYADPSCSGCREPFQPTP